MNVFFHFYSIDFPGPALSQVAFVITSALSAIQVTGIFFTLPYFIVIHQSG